MGDLNPSIYPFNGAVLAFRRMIHVLRFNLVAHELITLMSPFWPKMVRYDGIEPSSQLWKSHIIADILIPQKT